MSPFRELFVEVAQGLLEAAAIEAQQRKKARDLSCAYAPSRESQLVNALSDGAGERFMAKQFGWRRFDIVRDFGDRKLRITGELPCGHRHTIRVDEIAIALAVRGEILHALVEAIERRLAVKPRSCFCVQQEAA